MATVTIISFFFFNDTATTEIYTLSLHDALPIWRRCWTWGGSRPGRGPGPSRRTRSGAASSPCCAPCGDRKSTRLNSSHGYISYAVFCLKKKKMKITLVNKGRQDVSLQTPLQLGS